ncbi:MAG: cupredoxin domain-containing protein [Ktedonobacteraceae bacterium]
MYKKIMIGIVLLALLTTLLTACSIHANTGPTGPAVHMANTNFLQPSINISKGASLTLINDVATQHIITNGTWVDSTAKPAKEPGAPTVNANFTGNDNASIGPFSTAGTYHLYCTIHPGMNLKVIVQ